MQQNPQPQDQRAKRARDDQGVKLCHSCGKPGHKSRDCRSKGTRASRGNDAIAKSARDAVAEADGLKIALQEKSQELADLVSDKELRAKQEAALAKEEQERLKAELAQQAMIGRIALGSVKVTILKRLFSMAFTLVFVLLKTTLLHLLLHFLIPARLIFQFYLLMKTGRLLGITIDLKTRFWILLAVLCCQQVLFQWWLHYPLSLLKVMVAVSFLSLCWSIRECIIGPQKTWLLTSNLRTCPSKIWIRQPGLFGRIALPDVRDDSVNSVPLRHACDYLVKYRVISVPRLFRIIFDVTDLMWCALAGANQGTTFVTSLAQHLLVSNAWFDSIDLLVSASLARQVISPRNTPCSLSESEVAILVERAAANEGYSNVNSFESHGTLGNLRMNTKEYVLAVHSLYRQEMIEAGF